MTHLFTIGVYSKSESEFFEALAAAGIDTFCDVRNRRGMRGSQYAFVNSARLQARLASMGISYCHFKELAPPDEIREAQRREDILTGSGKRSRTTLGEAFKRLYDSHCLSGFNSEEFLHRLGTDARRVVLFCVEGAPEACHRSLLATRIAADLSVPVTHL